MVSFAGVGQGDLYYRNQYDDTPSYVELLTCLKKESGPRAIEKIDVTRDVAGSTASPHGKPTSQTGAAEQMRFEPTGSFRFDRGDPS